MPRITIPLWSFQKEAVRRMMRRGGRGGLFMEMGTGKTRTALAVAQGVQAERIVLVVPLSASGVWREEIHDVWPSARLISGVSGTLVERAHTLKRYAYAIRNRNGGSGDIEPEVFMLTVNYETFWRKPLVDAIEKWFSPDMYIFDEAHRLKHRNSKQSRGSHRIVSDVPFRLALTGSPQTHGIEDYFSIYKMIDPDVFGTVWSWFQARYLVMGGFKGKQITGYQNEDELIEKVHSTAFRITKNEALELPDEVDVRIPVELSKKTRAAYDELEEESVAAITGMVDGKRVSGTALARIILTTVLRLQQLTGGFVRIEEGEQIVEVGNDKLEVLSDLLIDVLEQKSHVVIFARFTPDIKRIRATLTKKFPKAGVFVLDGSVPVDKRSGVVHDWENASTGILIGQISVTALALDFTRASVGIFYSLDYDLTHYIQARSRIHRYGQKEKVTYYHLIARNSVDLDVYHTLLAREQLSKRVLDDATRRKMFEYRRQA